MEEKETPNKLELPDDDYVVFIPAEDLRSIERAINRMEQARQELHKIRESFRVNALKIKKGTVINNFLRRMLITI